MIEHVRLDGKENSYGIHYNILKCQEAISPGLCLGVTVCVGDTVLYKHPFIVVVRSFFSCFGRNCLGDEPLMPFGLSLSQCL